MYEESLERLCSTILACWVRDVKFLIDLVEEANTQWINLDLDVLFDEANSTFVIIDINTLIYLAYQTISSQFIQTLPETLQEKAYDSESIYTNYFESHLWYDSAEVNEIRENSAYYM